MNLNSDPIRNTLRCALNRANVALVQVNDDGSYAGRASTLAHRIGELTKRPVSLTAFPDAAAILAAIGEDLWDMAFIAVEPSRLGQITYSEAYAQVEVCFAVADLSRLRTVADVDTSGVRVSSTRTAAYDLVLRRILRQAELVSFDDSDQSFARFAAGETDCLAGIREALLGFIARRPGFRLLPGIAASIDQAVAVPRGRESLLTTINTAVAENRQMR